MRDGQGNTVVEGTGDNGAFAVTRATSDSNLLGVDPDIGCRLDGVDDSADAPRPGDQGSCAMAAAVERVELALASTSGVGLSCDVVVVKVDGSNASRSWDAASSIPNDGRERRCS